MGNIQDIKQPEQGFTLVELLVVTAIFSFMLAGGYLILASGQNAWQLTDAQIELQNSLRRTLERVSSELRETGPAGGGLTIANGGGINGSDIIKFSMPVVCQAGGSVINVNGDVAYWRAPLTWGCRQSTCMDKDNDCATVDYKYVEYRLNASNQLVRRVLDSGSSLVREDIFAQNITDLQASLQGAAVVTITATASTKTGLNRQVTAANTMNVYLRNRG